LLNSVVIDNTSLIYISHLHKSKAFFHYLRNLFHTIYFPTAVVSEYAVGLKKEPHREWILQRLNPEQGFYRLCTSYDSVAKIFVENHRGIDKGEAEAYAQFKQVNAQFILSDDKKFIAAVRQLDASVRVYTTLHLICWLEHAGLIPDWYALVKEVHKVRPFKSQELRVAYLQVAERLGINTEKRKVSLKCSLSKIL
jgi:predicted nucleic acid-binding protein